MSSISKQLLMYVALLVCIQSIHAYTFTDYIHRIGKKTLSLQHLCMYATVHPYVLDYVYQQVQDDVVWQKGSVEIRMHDICDLCVSIILELGYAAVCQLREDQLQEHMVLTIYGALLHKCLQQIFSACGLHDYVSAETKQQYRLYGSNYIKAALACVCNHYVDSSKYQ